MDDIEREISNDYGIFFDQIKQQLSNDSQKLKKWDYCLQYSVAYKT